MTFSSFSSMLKTIPFFDGEVIEVHVKELTFRIGMQSSILPIKTNFSGFKYAQVYLLINASVSKHGM